MGQKLEVLACNTVDLHEIFWKPQGSRKESDPESWHVTSIGMLCSACTCINSCWHKHTCIHKQNQANNIFKNNYWIYIQLFRNEHEFIHKLTTRYYLCLTYIYLLLSWNPLDHCVPNAIQARQHLFQKHKMPSCLGITFRLFDAILSYLKKSLEN